MDCNGNIYNIGMGCCEPKLGPIENYYTKPTIDRMLDEITSAITSGCCITPEEVDEKIDEAISGITVSGVTEEQMNEAIASAKTEIEGEIPSLDGYATEQWVEDKHYITGVDLSDYALKSEIPTVPTSNTAFTNDAGYITGVDLSNYATKDNLTAATDDMATKTWVNNQGYLTEHQSLTAYSTTQEVNTMINQSVSGKQDTLSAGTNITIVDNVISAQGGGATYTAGTGIDITDNVISSTLPLSAGTGSKSIIEGYHVNIASGAASHAEGLYTEAKNIAEHASGMYNVSHTGNTTATSTLFSVGNGDENTRRNAFEIRQNGDIYIRKNNTDVRLQDITPGIWCGTMAEYQQISGSTDNNTIYLIHS